MENLVFQDRGVLGGPNSIVSFRRRPVTAEALPVRCCEALVNKIAYFVLQDPLCLSLDIVVNGFFFD
jgi:hypothetical protein